MLSACDRMDKWQVVSARRLIRHFFMYVMRQWQSSVGRGTIRHLSMWIG